MKIPIATSIAPHNIALQQKAISSWLQLGFDVISVNSREEISKIKDHFLGVTFETTDRNASALTGKPFVFLDDILEVLSSTGSEVCSILNSDIYLETDADFLNFLPQQVEGGLVFGSRIDVTSLSSLMGAEYFGGFDYFFFSRSIIEDFHKTDFCLGVPWWDYWVPLFSILKGYPVKQLVTPVAYHLEHPIRWNKQFLTGFGDRLLQCLMETDINKNIDDVFRERIALSKINSDYGLLAILIINFIFRNTDKVFYFKASEQLNNNPVSCETCHINEKKLHYYKNRERQMVDFLEEQLIKIRTSMSWKITAPLRKAYDRIWK